MSLYNKYRPCRFKDVVGQEKVISTLQSYLQNGGLPHALMMVGSSGVGKTTVARILKNKLGCADGDFQEIDCAAKDGPDQIRDIRQFVSVCPIGGKSRIWFLEEVQSLSRAGFCQQSLLKVMEDCPSHAYFLLATTDPTKIIKAIHTRCKRVDFHSLSVNILVDLVTDVANKEGKAITKAVADAIAESADGSPRQALVTLEEVLTLGTEADQLEAVVPSTVAKGVDELVKALLWEKPKWKSIADILSGLKGEDVEGLRRRILATAATCALKADRNSERAAAVASEFSFDTFASGFAGLVVAAHRVFGNCK